MIGAIVHQLTRNLKDSQIQDSAFAPYFVDHTAGVYPTAASGFPYTAASMQVKGDPMADLVEDLAADAPTMQEESIMKSRCAKRVFRHFTLHPRKDKASEIPMDLDGDIVGSWDPLVDQNMVDQNLNHFPAQMLHG